MDNLVSQEVAVIGAISSFVVAIAALVKAWRSDGKASKAVTAAEKTTTDQVGSTASSRPEAVPYAGPRAADEEK